MKKGSVYFHEYNSVADMVGILERPKCTLLRALRVSMKFVFLYDLHCVLVAGFVNCFVTDATISDSVMSKSVHLHQREFGFEESDWQLYHVVSGRHETRSDWVDGASTGALMGLICHREIIRNST
jgi:hypothetical protein